MDPETRDTSLCHATSSRDLRHFPTDPISHRDFPDRDRDFVPNRGNSRPYRVLFPFVLALKYVSYHRFISF